MADETTQAVKPQLGFWDAVSIMVGIVIGTTIYEMPPTIAKTLPGPWWVLGAWALGGVLSVIGAFCYAELASTYPRMGGDYVYLTRAFGSFVGFLFGWAQLAVILTASTGSMAFVFGRYAVNLWGMSADATVVFALAAVLAFTLLNLGGVVLGKQTQNLLSATKVLGLGAILIAGLAMGQSGTFGIEERKPIFGGFDLAMIFVLYGYGGWNDMAFVAADLKDRRNITRSLLLGTLLITAIYLLINAAYIVGLGFDELRNSEAVASDVLRLMLGNVGANVMSVLVMISALGAVNGLIFAGTRVYAPLGAEHSIFAALGRWHPRWGSPIWALAAQGAIALGMIFIVGTEGGRAAIDSVWNGVGRPPIPWGKFGNSGFTMLVSATAPVFWAFFLLTGVSFFVLRFKDPDVERPFKLPMPAYPILPLIFCAFCIWMLYRSAIFAEDLAVIGVLPLLAAVPMYFLSTHRPSVVSDFGEPTEPTAV